MDFIAPTAGPTKEFQDSGFETENESTVHTSQREEKESVIKVGQDCTNTEFRYTMATFLLTVNISINGKQVSLTKDKVDSQLLLCCKSLKYSANLKTILPNIEEILQKNGVLQIGKCHELPFLGIEIEFGTIENMTSFLSCLEEMKACLLPPFRKLLVDRHEQAGRSVEMHLALSILLLFQSKEGPRFVTVNLDNCSQCFEKWSAGELPYLSSTLASEICSHPESEDPLTSKMIFNELKELGGREWFMLGFQLGVPIAKLNTIEEAHPRNSDRCKVEMIEAWINAHEIASWSDILSALLACDYDRIAIRIANKYDTPLPRKENERILSEMAPAIKDEIVALRQQLNESQKHLEEVSQQHKQCLSREEELVNERIKLVETVYYQAKHMSELDKQKTELRKTLHHNNVGVRALKYAQEGYEKELEELKKQASITTDKFRQELQTKIEDIETLKQSIQNSEQTIKRLHTELEENNRNLQIERTSQKHLNELLKQKEKALSETQQKLHELETEREKLLTVIAMKQKELDGRIKQFLPTGEDKKDISQSEYEELSLSSFTSWKKSDECWFSPPFYSHQNGYKLCLIVYPNDTQDGQGTHVSLCLTIMRGEYDDNLLWPFRGRVRVMMLNQKDNNHITHEQAITQELAKKNGYDYGSRVYGEISNRGVGFSRFVSHDQLETCGYLLNDSLKFRIIVL